MTTHPPNHHTVWDCEDSWSKTGSSFIHPIWFFFLLPKMKVLFNSKYFVHYQSPKTSSAQIFQSPHVFRNPPNMHSAQTSYFNSISTIVSTRHFQLKLTSTKNCSELMTSFYPHHKNWPLDLSLSHFLNSIHSPH